MLKDCLIEIGTEELPPRALQSLSQSLAHSYEQGLDELGLEPGAVEIFASPRRLAILLRDTPLQQPEQVVEKRGPSLEAAFDADGNPSRAAQGFAASCGVDIDQLERREIQPAALVGFAGFQLLDIYPAGARKSERGPRRLAVGIEGRGDRRAALFTELVGLLQGDFVEQHG